MPWSRVATSSRPDDEVGMDVLASGDDCPNIGVISVARVLRSSDAAAGDGSILLLDDDCLIEDRPNAAFGRTPDPPFNLDSLPAQ